MIRAPLADEIDTFAKHVRFYLEPNNQYMLRFLDEGETIAPPWTHFATVADELRAMLEDLAEGGHRAFFTELTTADISDLGLHVGRVLVPSLHPLSCGSGLTCLDDRRLRRVAEVWAMSELSTFNSDPHPFP
jgi:ribosomal protein S12 methylthiotransferase accessory factor